MDKMDMQRFKELISLYLTDRLGPADGAELAGLLRQSVYQTQFEQIVQEQLDSRAFDLEEPSQAVHRRIQSWLEQRWAEEGTRSAVLHSLPVGEEKAQLRHRDGKRAVIFRWASAAAVVFFIVLGGYFYFTREPEILSQAQRFKNDIRPGGLGATLLLADGSKIALHDSLAQYGAGGHMNGMRRITTAKGETYTLVLPDGTKVRLNSASTLTYPARFDGAERKVELTGEAFFEIRHNEHQPFSIQLADEAVVRDLGTKFNIRAYADEPGFRTTLVEGAAEMQAGTGKVSLKPGEAAEYWRLKELTVDSTANIKRDIAWKDNQFVLDHTGLGTVMSELQRWYNAEVIYDDAVKNDTTLFFGALPRNVPVSQVLAILEATGHVHFMIEGNTIKVMK